MLVLKYYNNTHYNLYKAIVLIDLYKLQKTFKTKKLPYLVTPIDHVPKYILFSKTQPHSVAAVYELLLKIQKNTISKLKNSTRFFYFLSPLSKKESCLKNNKTDKNQLMTTNAAHLCLSITSKLSNKGNINK